MNILDALHSYGACSPHTHSHPDTRDRAFYWLSVYSSFRRTIFLWRKDAFILRVVNSQLAQHSGALLALEQDRHLLKRKLETVRTEYDIRITELQADIRELSRSLTERESVLKQSEKEKAALITELTEQNDRLTSQLKEVPPRRRKCTYSNSAPENVFTSGARGGNGHHNTSLDHDLYLQYVDVTVTPFTVGQPHQDEKQNLSHFKQFEYLPLSCLFTPTENTAHKLTWSCNMEEQLTNQIQTLRDQCNEKKSSLQDHVNSIEILREEINMMSEKKAELERRMQTLLKEREALNSGLDDATYKIMSLEHQIREQELQLRQCQREVMELHELNSMLGSQVETLSNKVQSNNHSLLQEMECDDMSHTNESYKLKEEALSVYQQLQLIYDHLTHYQRINSSFSEMTSETVPLKEETLQTFKVGLLSETTQNLSTLVNQVLNQRSGRDQNSTDRSVELDEELLRTRDTMNTLQHELDKKIEELKQQTEVVVDLRSKLTIREAELASVTEERDQARADLMDTYLAQDEVVQKAREARDKAMSRKNMVEIQLAKTRVEMMQTSSQLMEAIQQKVGLSQQLEEWQVR
uniref:(California timema) hypothetical protein n=2 Tax=Timema TaxID=61471 RepID=A0A7R9J720_TIMCA|nr:unnamed protein product [Timema californicum]